jgi:hypothetical protein
MRLTLWRLTALLLAALNMGMTWAHVLELPAKMRYDGRRWTQLQLTLYRAFGSEGPGMWIEPASVAAAGVLAFQVRGRPAFRLTVAAGSLLGLALAAWFAVIAPMNATFARWTPDALPADWTRVRRQWEYGHAARFALHLAGFGALVLSVLTPARTG